MKTFYIISSSLFVPFLFFLSLAQRLRNIFNTNCLNSVNSRKVVFGSTPLLNNKYWSKALCDAGHYSKTFVSHYFDSISNESDWDYLLNKTSEWLDEFAWGGFRQGNLPPSGREYLESAGVNCAFFFNGNKLPDESELDWSLSTVKIYLWYCSYLKKDITIECGIDLVI